MFDRRGSLGSFLPTKILASTSPSDGTVDNQTLKVCARLERAGSNPAWGIAPVAQMPVFLENERALDERAIWS